MLQQGWRQLLNSRYHLLLTEPLKDPSDGNWVCEQMGATSQEISARAECLINPAALRRARPTLQTCDAYF